MKKQKIQGIILVVMGLVVFHKSITNGLLLIVSGIVLLKTIIDISI